MLKVYKRTIRMGRTEASQGRDLSMNTDKVMTGSITISDWLTITAMIAGAIVGTLVFSVFFVVILIPIGLLGLGAWLRLRQLKNGQMDQSIEVEYKVITNTEKTINREVAAGWLK
jgi:hypothetical protein